jgi:hypothetical protein
MRGRRLAILLVLVALVWGPALAQTQTQTPSQNPNQVPSLSPEQRADTEALRALMNSTPLLPVERIELKVNPPLTLEGYSAAAADKQGHIYVIHRPEDANVDPVVVLDSKGNLLRSWGKGMYTMPHGIRIDPAGNVWTIDARTSMIFKFTPEGKKLLEINVGDIPDASLPFCGATDVTFAANGHVYVSDGYCNARFIEYSADGKKVVVSNTDAGGTTKELLFSIPDLAKKQDSPEGKPDKTKTGLYFQGRVQALWSLGYQVDWKLLNGWRLFALIALIGVAVLFTGSRAAWIIAGIALAAMNNASGIFGLAGEVLAQAMTC